MNRKTIVNVLRRVLMLAATGAIVFETTSCSSVDTLTEWMYTLLGYSTSA